jgi:hypothetical protein
VCELPVSSFLLILLEIDPVKIKGTNIKTHHFAVWDIRPDTRMFSRQEYEALARGETVLQGETIFHKTNWFKQWGDVAREGFRLAIGVPPRG